MRPGRGLEEPRAGAPGKTRKLGAPDACTRGPCRTLWRCAGRGWAELDGEAAGQSRGQLTSAASLLGSCRRSSSGTRLRSTSFRRGPRSPTRSPPRPRRTSVPRSPTAEARTESRACGGGRGQGTRRSGREPGEGGAAGRGRSGGRGRGGAGLTSSSSGGRRGPSSALSSRTGARGRSRSLRSAPSAASTSRASPSPRAPSSAGSSLLRCRACGGRDSWAGPRRPRPPPGPAPHLPAAQRQVAQAEQAQPAHGGLGVALPGAEPLQDDLLPQKPCRGPTLQQLNGDAGSACSRSPGTARRPGPRSPVTARGEAGSPR